MSPESNGRTTPPCGRALDVCRPVADAEIPIKVDPSETGDERKLMARDGQTVRGAFGDG